MVSHVDESQGQPAHSSSPLRKNMRGWGAFAAGGITGILVYAGIQAAAHTPSVTVFPGEDITAIEVGKNQYILPGAQCEIPMGGQSAVPLKIYFSDIEADIRNRGAQARDSIRADTRQQVSDSYARLQELFMRQD